MILPVRKPLFNHFVITSIVLIALFLNACSSGGGGDDDNSNQNKPETLTGTVTDMASASAMEGVDVTAVDSNNNVKTTTTDANGTYSIELVTNTAYQISFSSYSYSTHIESDVQLNEGETNTLDATLAIAPLGTVVGQVKDAANQATLLANVTVTVFDIHNINRGTFNTLGDGSFSIDLPEGSPVSLNFELTGYIPTTYGGVIATSSQVTSLDPIFLVDTSREGTGGLSGNIVDSTTGLPIENATVNFRSGINNVTGAVLVSVFTDIDGNYTVNLVLDAGTYTCEIVLDGYITIYATIFVFGNEIRLDQNASISPVLNNGQTRIVLSWGENPSDLDSHLTGPESNDPAAPRFHIYFGEYGFADETPFAELDIDDTSSFGPETITIYQQHSGVYRFSVHDFSNSGATNSEALANSGAKVELFRQGFPTQTFFVPSGIGTLWTVFELNGNTVTPVNSMSNESNEGSIQSVIFNTDKALFKNLPKK